jgi:hypothetical protein
LRAVCAKLSEQWAAEAAKAERERAKPSNAAWDLPQTIH